MKRRVTIFFVGIIFSGIVVFNYLNQLIFRYQVPPGGDAANHDRIVHQILSGDHSIIYRYHTVWHLIVIVFSWLFHARSITVMAWLGPLLLASCALSLYLFNRRFYGIVAGITSMILIGFFSFQPLQTLWDGGFPNVLAAGTILPLFILQLASVAQAKRKPIALLVSALLFILLFYSHHITTLYSLVILAVVGIILGARKMRDYHVHWVFIIPGLVAIIGLLPYVIRWIFNLRIGSTGDLAKEFMTLTSHYPFIAFTGHLDNPNAYWPFQVFPNAIGEAVVYLGILGFVVALFHLASRKTEAAMWRASLILVTWAFVLLAGSQIFSIGFPVRLARDLAIPLALLGGVFMQSVYNYIDRSRLPKLLFCVIIGLGITIGFTSLTERMRRELAPNPLVSHLAVDSRAADYITDHLPLHAKIIGFYDDTYLPMFAPLHNIQWAQGAAFLDDIAKQKDLDNDLESIDYLYFERRYDRGTDAINNDGLIKNYLRSQKVSLVAVFEQPEKKVWLFRVNH